MKNKSTRQARMEREHRKSRRDQIDEAGRCQNPDCPGQFPRDLCVNELTPGHGPRGRAFGERLARNVLCAYCNCNEFTDRKKWPLERQVALQIKLCADIATPQEVIDCVLQCASLGPKAITWADVVRWYFIIDRLPSNGGR